MADSPFRTIVGFVAFDPKPGEANGKKIRNIQVRQTGIHEQEALDVSCTLWEDSLGHVAVGKGDFVAVEGKLTRREAGEKTYNNLSAVGIKVLGAGDSGRKPAVDNPVADDPEDLPF